jgi:hypothetical protein
LEERVCTRGEQERAIPGGGTGDAIWSDVPAPGDSHHRGQFAAGEGLRFILHLLGTTRHYLVGQ